MNRDYYLDLARRGLRFVIGADLVLHEDADPERTRRNGEGLGRVVEKTARRQKSPLAIPLMDLRLEKLDLLGPLHLSEAEADAWKLAEPDEELFRALESAPAGFPELNRAQHEAVRYIDEQTDLLPVGMVIGPFSLTTKLMADPIAAVAMAGGGVTPDEEPQVRLLTALHALAERAVLRSAKAQLQAGARALLVCEPAANIVYLSPRQMRQGADIFERFVLGPNRRLKQTLKDGSADLFFHDCGELLTEMVRAFGEDLHPKILSLGSSRKLWDDAAVVPKDVVLYGNLPTKSFYSDAAMPVEEVLRRTRELIREMRKTGHAHILGSECDVLWVDGAADTIRNKVEAMQRHEVAQ